MTYATEKARIGRIPVQVVEIDVDVCEHTYGSAPCTASGGSGSECYNTRGTCQDPANYSATTKTYSFCSTDAPAEVVRAGYIPALRSISTAPTKIQPEKGLSTRESRTLSLLDFTHHDRGIDPYVANRSYDPETQGTFWGRWLARNKYYTGRAIRIIEAYVSPDGMDLSADSKTHHYLLDKIDGPTRGGVSITAKDVLKLADNDRAQCPVKSEGALASDITDSATSLTVTTGKGSDYATYRGAAVSGSNPGYVRINDEIIEYTGVSTDTLTGLTRSQWGTVAAAHSADDDVQMCWSCEDENAVDIVQELLEDFAAIDSAYIPSADWTTERDKWLSSANVTAIISEPTGVQKLVGELCEQLMVNIWWSDDDQEIKLKSIIPDNLNTSTVDYTDAHHLLRDTIKVKRDPDRRLSRVVMWYSPRDWSDKIERDNMAYGLIQAAATEEGANLYGQQRIKIVESRWIPSQALASQTASRLLNRRKDDPIMIEFQLDAKDDALAVGDSVTIETHHLQDVDGSAKATKFQILSRELVERGSKWKYSAQNLQFSGRYAFVMQDSANDYGSATEAELTAGGYIAPSASGFSDGGEPYKIL